MACDVDAADSTTDAAVFAGQTREVSGIMECPWARAAPRGPRCRPWRGSGPSAEAR